VLTEPTLTHRCEGGHDIPLLVWRLPVPARAISSAVVGGGLGECRWVINASVPMSYDRDDPAARQYQVYPKNLARQHVGSNLFVYNTTTNQYVPTEASAAWLDEDVTTGWPVLA